MKNISFYTTCKGRLSHLKETLPKNLSCDGEFVILDYCCPENTGNWIRNNFSKEISLGIINYYRYNFESNFHISHAKNIAASLCKNEIICSVDADCYISSDFTKELLSIFSKEKRFSALCEKKYGHPQLWGLIACLKTDFLKIRGYNESFTNYGYDDIDLANRLSNLGLEKIPWNPNFVKTIKHENRVDFYEEKDTVKSTNINRQIAEVTKVVNPKGWSRAVLTKNFKNQINLIDGCLAKMFL